MRVDIQLECIQEGLWRHSIGRPFFFKIDLKKEAKGHPFFWYPTGFLNTFNIQLISWDAFCYSQLRRLTGSNLLTFFLTYLLTFFLTYFFDILSYTSFDTLCAILFWHIWHSDISFDISSDILPDISSYILSILSDNLLTFFLTLFLTYLRTFFLTLFLTYLLTFFLTSWRQVADIKSNNPHLTGEE